MRDRVAFGTFRGCDRVYKYMFVYVRLILSSIIVLIFDSDLKEKVQKKNEYLVLGLEKYLKIVFLINKFCIVFFDKKY